MAEQAGLNVTWSKIPEDTFSRDVAHIISILSYKNKTLKMTRSLHVLHTWTFPLQTCLWLLFCSSTICASRIPGIEVTCPGPCLCSIFTRYWTTWPGLPATPGTANWIVTRMLYMATLRLYSVTAGNADLTNNSCSWERHVWSTFVRAIWWFVCFQYIKSWKVHV